jgi:hypothetical protein
MQSRTWDRVALLAANQPPPGAHDSQAGWSDDIAPWESMGAAKLMNISSLIGSTRMRFVHNKLPTSSTKMHIFATVLRRRHLIRPPLYSAIGTANAITKIQQTALLRH